MSKTNFYYVVVIDIFRDKLLQHKLCFNRAEAKALQSEWEKEYIGYHVEFFKY